MHFETTYKLEDFVLDTKWEDLPKEVQERMRGCFVDLLGALIVGSRSKQFEVGKKLAETIYGAGDIPVIGSQKRFNFLGASAAMGHSSNAYDIDDGHNMTRAHPGTSFVGAVLAAAYEKDISKNEFLATMLVAYEATIRSGAAIMDYYNFAHSSGTFGAVGTACGVGRLYGFTREQLNNVISIAEFNAPLVPGIRSVEYPSMNKDGVPFGVMVGALAIMDAMCGFEGNKNLLEADEYKHYLDDLGKTYQVLNLYFKPYPCCRWAHPALDACRMLLNGYGIKKDDIEAVHIKTFEKATMLSKIIPNTTDEAQYNIAYPIAATLVHGDFTLSEVRDSGLKEKEVHEMMKRLHFEVDPDFDSAFPEKRICQVIINTKDGNTYTSDECEPRGEAHENVSVQWLCDKFLRMSESVYSKQAQKTLIDLVTSEEDMPIRKIIDTINAPECWIDK